MKALQTILSISVLFFSISSWAYTAMSYCPNENALPLWTTHSPREYLNLMSTPDVVDQIVISKKLRQLYLIKDNKVLKAYDVAFGLNPEGHKQFEGDNKTPEGFYYVESKNPRSAFNLALRVSYPNAEDIRRAVSVGKSPGGDIMIHGFPNNAKERAEMIKKHPAIDWTQGCIAVTNKEINEIFNLVPVGAPIEICPL
jgi:murein L,D-transpeptidase YafK